MIEIAILSVISIWMNGCSSKVSSDKFIKNTNQKIDEIIKYIENKEKGIETKYKVLNYTHNRGKCKYYGEVKNLKPHGFGKAIYEIDEKRSKVYIGEWKNGMYHGKGIEKTNIFGAPPAVGLFVIDGVEARVWEADKNADRMFRAQEEIERLRQQESNILESNKGIYDYVGYFKYGDYNGLGKIYHDNGKTNHLGNFLNGFEDGFGIEYDVKGIKVYEGNWLDGGGFSGVGIQFDKNGKKIYEGKWLNGERNGKGKLTLANGTVYEGNWLNGKRNGKGTLFNKNGKKIYEGNWVNGKSAPGK